VFNLADIRFIQFEQQALLTIIPFYSLLIRLLLPLRNSQMAYWNWTNVFDTTLYFVPQLTDKIFTGYISTWEITWGEFTKFCHMAAFPFYDCQIRQEIRYIYREYSLMVTFMSLASMLLKWYIPCSYTWLVIQMYTQYVTDYRTWWTAHVARVRCNKRG
jgi:hypothetical protein